MLLTIILMTLAFLAITVAVWCAWRELQATRAELATARAELAAARTALAAITAEIEAARARRSKPTGPLRDGFCPDCGQAGVYLRADGSYHRRFHQCPTRVA